MDREKVIKALECLKEGSYCECCDYKPHDDCIKRVATDAISLLKEQEAKQVNISQTHIEMKYGLCPRCGKQIDTLVNPHYCGNCGQAVKWNERVNHQG